jgi:hypothetical protein
LPHRGTLSIFFKNLGMTELVSVDTVGGVGGILSNSHFSLGQIQIISSTAFIEYQIPIKYDMIDESSTAS